MISLNIYLSYPTAFLKPKYVKFLGKLCFASMYESFSFFLYV